jgi:Cu(I)/Ag(I) efflux system membrane fusion protein
MTSTYETQRGAKIAALVVAVGVLGVGAGYWIGTQRTPEHVARGTVEQGSAAGNATAASASRARRVLYWHDPMVPGQKFDKPGKSPFMDMDLVPVYADDAVDAGKVTISPRLTQAFGVRTVEAKEGALASDFTAVGAIAVDERSIVAVQARSQGYIEKLRVRAQYDGVVAGQALADLYVPDWLAAEEELLALKSSTQPGAARLFAAARERLALLGVPEAEIARVEREGRPQARVTMTAPQSGIVWEIGARDGMAVMPGTTIYRIAGLASVWVIAEVPEAQAALLAVGAPVEVRAAAFPDRVFKGAVGTLLPELSAQTRTVRARIVVANPGALLRPGMFADVAFRGPSAAKSVLVPSEAVIRTGTRDVVVIADADGRFAPVEVEVGRESGELTEVRKGLAAGQRVVASSQFLVDSEANLKGALQRISSPASEEAMKVAQAPPQVHKAEGIVRSVGDDVLIKHGPIASIGMGAMTMPYKAPKGGIPKNVTPGTNVKFEFVVTPQGDMQLTSIVPAPQTEKK